MSNVNCELGKEWVVSYQEGYCDSYINEKDGVYLTVGESGTILTRTPSTMWLPAIAVWMLIYMVSLMVMEPTW